MRENCGQRDTEVVLSYKGGAKLGVSLATRGYPCWDWGWDWDWCTRLGTNNKVCIFLDSYPVPPFAKMAGAAEGWVSPSGDYLHNPDVFTRYHMMGTCSHIAMEAHAAELSCSPSVRSLLCETKTRWVWRGWTIWEWHGAFKVASGGTSVKSRVGVGVPPHPTPPPLLHRQTCAGARD